MRHLSRPPVLALLAGATLCASALCAGDTPPQYAGTKTCEECHQQGYKRFAATRMARVFFEAPRNELEALGCEACHGPGQEHVAVAREHDRARERGIAYQGPPSGQFILRLGKDSTLPVRDQNARCLQCHEKGQRMFWQGSAHESRGLACVTCHQVHQNGPPAVAATRFTAALTSNMAFTKRTSM